jgi:two-component system, OmpR family, alkaline phosphatase synthesis response regulator PhoP
MPADRTRVLVVHRGSKLVRRIREQAESLDNFEVHFTEYGEAFAAGFADQTPDVIVLDLTVAVPPGFTIYRILESRSPLMPPLAIFRAGGEHRTTQRNRERWRVIGGIETLETRLHVALGRRSHRFSWLPVQFAGEHLVADLPNTHVEIDGRTVSISAREGEVLGLLLTHCNRLVRRELLISEIWGYETRSLDVHIRRLRQKLGSAGGQLETVTAFGYRFTEAGFAPVSRPDNSMEFTQTKQVSHRTVVPPE